MNARCQFLGDDDRCTIYEDRPQACRAFGCVGEFSRNGIAARGEFLRRNAPVVQLLENL
jgi:Fe-S-cluster containining protein